jgi:hypothetical protein
MSKRTPQLDIAPNTVTRRLNADEAKQIAIEWMSTFGSNCGSIDSDSFLWHVFSGGCYPPGRWPSLTKRAGLDRILQDTRSMTS